MCGIVGISSFVQELAFDQNKIEKMCRLLSHRGPDDEGIQIYQNTALGHRRLSIIDLKNGHQPLRYQYNEKEYCIVYNGELYNMKEIKEDLVQRGYPFQTSSDTEVILVAYLEYGYKCVQHFEGIFSFVIYSDQELFGARDHLGVKPLFYSYYKDHFVFASEIKALLFEKQRAIVDQIGLLELLGLGPSLSPGKTIYKGIESLRPGHYFIYDRNGLKIERYFKLHALKHKDDYETTKQKVRSLVIHSITQQLLSDVEVSAMLSGGVDSSIICAIAAKYLPTLATYSVSYEDQNRYFKAYDYQTTQDQDYINLIVDQYHTHHHAIILSQKELVNHLKTALIARDMPGMADVDSSFFCFARHIASNHKVVLSGECADEIFGGYPWFYKSELKEKENFPWLLDQDLRLSLFRPEIQKLPFKAYIQNAYNQSILEAETLNESPEDQYKRKMIYLCSEWFMQTLLTRSDSQTMHASIECRVPFASAKLMQYVYNIPWKYLYHDGHEKALLRDAFKNELPIEILERKKNPYPKTHSPIYCDLVCNKLNEALKDQNSILYRLFLKDQLNELIKTKGNSFKFPWFGQLMMGPQFLAYLYQIHLWGQIYQIELDF